MILWIATAGVGILADFLLHRYPDYPEFHPLQRLQYMLFWGTIAIMVRGALWRIGGWIRRRFK